MGPVGRYLTLAADRNLSLDVAAAERQYARALELIADDAPERPRRLARWAEALLQRGRFRESAEAFAAAADGLRLQGDVRAAAAALGRSQLPLEHLLDPSFQTVLADAERLLEGEPISPELVALLSERAGERSMCGDWDAAIASSERAMAVAEPLNLPVPARALGFHGMARCLGGGDAGGIDDVRQALAAAQEEGLGREVAVLYSNLAVVLAVHQGMREVLEVQRDGLRYARNHGIEEWVLTFRVEIVATLTSMGRWDEALAEAAALAPLLDRRDSAWMRLAVLNEELLIRARRGRDAVIGAPTADLLAAARGSGVPDDAAQALLACAEAAWALGDGVLALSLLSECLAVPDVGETTPYAWYLGEAVRVALAAGGFELAARLFEAANGDGPMYRPQPDLRAGGTCWSTAGTLNEAAHGVFPLPPRSGRSLADSTRKRGRCSARGAALWPLGRAPEAAASLAAAREIFFRLRARPCLAEVDRLFDVAMAASH